MTKFGQLIRNVLEKLAGTYYGGPHPPEYLAQKVIAFAGANPNATVREWMEFSTRLGHSSYTGGYMRGLEWAERDLDRLQLGDPELLAEQARHDFTWHTPWQPTAEQMAMKPRGPLLETLPDDGARARYLDHMARYQGGYRLTVDPPEPVSRPQKK